MKHLRRSSSVFSSARYLLAAVTFTLFLSGCSSLGVKVYERGILAQDDMQLVSEPLEVGFEDHTYFSKEASTGGRGFGGGGCGCN